MKEAFWGVLIVMLGLFGIVVINLFQNVTVDNDRVYYLIKESTEAAAFDALDLTRYRLSGTLRIVEEKFAENLTRRFAESVTIGDYKIIVEDINELPPKVSLRVTSGISTINGEQVGIVNRVDGILETKYNLDEVLSFLNITETEWTELTERTVIEVDPESGQNVCKITTTPDEFDCVPGDLKFEGWGNVSIVNAICQDGTLDAKTRVANYKYCDCGRWVEKNKTVSATPVKEGTEWVYTWNFEEVGELRTLSESIKGRVQIQQCTVGIDEMVPNDIDEKTPKEDGTSYEPSIDNSKYMLCPAGGIKIPVGMKFTMHPQYDPLDSVNRSLEWSIRHENPETEAINMQSSNPATNCRLNDDASNCFSRAIITANEVGVSYVDVKTTRGQTATCKVEVYDGTIDSVSCEDLSVSLGDSAIIKTSYIPKNATKVNLEFSISNTDVATVEGNTVKGKGGGSATITVTETNTGKTGTCTVTVPSPPPPPPTYEGGSSGKNNPSGYWKVEDPVGTIKYYASYEEAQEAAKKTASKNQPSVISYKNAGKNTPEIKYSEVLSDDNAGTYSLTTETIYNGNIKAQEKIQEERNYDGLGLKKVTQTTTKYNKDGTETVSKDKPYERIDPAPVVDNYDSGGSYPAVGGTRYDTSYKGVCTTVICSGGFDTTGCC